MNIYLVEPFFDGSHKSWALQFQKYSEHNVTLFTLPGRFWKWRMHGAAITLSNEVNALDEIPDLFIVSDFLDLGLFKSLLKKEFSEVKIAVYFHENQFAYPFSENDTDIKEKRDNHYSFINYSTALVADRVLFNSQYNFDSFFDGVDKMLSVFPDYNNYSSIDVIKNKSEVLSLGLELTDFVNLDRVQNSTPIILWNHRWEHDKNPLKFYYLLSRLKKEGLEFKLILLGEQSKQQKEIYSKILIEFEQEIIHEGFADSREQYLDLLAMSDVLPVTSNQDFFGISIAEAIAAGVRALLPERLSYPFVFDGLADFYHDDNGLFQQCRLFLIEREVAVKEVRKEILKYEWTNGKIKEYDDLFTSMIF